MYKFITQLLFLLTHFRNENDFKHNNRHLKVSLTTKLNQRNEMCLQIDLRGPSSVIPVATT